MLKQKTVVGGNECFLRLGFFLGQKVELVLWRYFLVTVASGHGRLIKGCFEPWEKWVLFLCGCA